VKHPRIRLDDWQPIVSDPYIPNKSRASGLVSMRELSHDIKQIAGQACDAVA